MNFNDLSFGQKTLESEREKLNELRDANEISMRSFQFLEQKLESFNDNWVLDDYEERILDDKIRYHKEFKEKRDEFKKNKNTFSNKSQLEISKLFQENEWTNIDSSSLYEIKNKIKKDSWMLKDNLFFWNSYRDKISKYIDFTDSMESVAFLRWFHQFDEFYDKFVLNYINFLEENYTPESLNELNNDSEKGLLLNKHEIEKLIFNFAMENTDLFKKLGSAIDITANDGNKINIKSSDILEKVDFQNKKNYANELFGLKMMDPYDLTTDENIKEFSWIKSNVLSDELSVSYIHFMVENNYLDSLNVLKYIELLSIETRKYLIENKVITKSELSLKLEELDNYNYEDFLNTYWLTEENEALYLKAFEIKLIWKNIIFNHKKTLVTKEFIETNKEDILNNYLVLNKMIVNIESKWNNIDNIKWESSSKWYYQYLDWNGYTSEVNWEKEIYLSSVKTWLRNLYKFYSWMDWKNVSVRKLKYNSKVPNWIITAFNEKDFDLKTLSAEKQSLIFTWDYFESIKEINGKIPSDFLALASVWNTWAIKKFYLDFHHTGWKKVADIIKENMERWINKYAWEISHVLNK